MRGDVGERLLCFPPRIPGRRKKWTKKNGEIKKPSSNFHSTSLRPVIHLQVFPFLRGIGRGEVPGRQQIEFFFMRSRIGANIRWAVLIAFQRHTQNCASLLPRVPLRIWNTLHALRSHPRTILCRVESLGLRPFSRVLLRSTEEDPRTAGIAPRIFVCTLQRAVAKEFVPY